MIGNLNLYTVYNNKTDEVVIVCGTAKECAERMGICEASFFSTFCRVNKGFKTRWHIMRADRDENAKKVEKIRKIYEPKVGTFGTRIRRRRHKIGLSIADMARKIGVHSTTLTLYELDKHTPSLFMAACIADALDVSLDYLTGRSEKE